MPVIDLTISGGALKRSFNTWELGGAVHEIHLESILNETFYKTAGFCKI